MRIRQWVGGLPSPELLAQYKAKRQEQTDNHVAGTYTRMREKLDGVGAEEPRPKVGSKEYYQDHPIITENRERVKAMRGAGLRTMAIVRETGLTRYWVEKILALK